MNRSDIYKITLQCIENMQGFKLLEYYASLLLPIQIQSPLLSDQP